MDIFFSVVVPCYKPQYLRECIASILGQTYTNLELILVNDGSPYPEVDEIIKSFPDPRIHYFRRKKGFGAERLVDNWNDCLTHVTGDYVINMGDDDKLMPDCLERYTALISKYPDLDLYHTRAYYINEQSNITDIQPPAPEWESVWSLIWYVTNGRITMLGDFLYRVSTLRANGGWYNLPLAWGSDNMSAFIAAKSHGVANTYEPGFCFRRNSQHISGSTKWNRTKVECRDHCWNLIEDFAKNNKATGQDSVLRQLLLDNLPEMRRRTKMVLVAQEVDAHPSHFWWWLRHRKKYGFNMFNMLNLLQNNVIIPSLVKLRSKIKK